MQKIRVHFDGACDNNAPIPMMGIGVAVWINNERRPELDRWEACGNGTNNIAEYLALALALTVVKEMNLKRGEAEVHIYGDSQLIVNQHNGQWDIKADHLKEYFHNCRSIRGHIQCVCKVHWVKRTFNTEADILSKRGVKEYFEKAIEQNKRK